MSNSYNLFALFACLMVGLLYSRLLYGQTSILSKNLQYGLAVLRTIVVGTILWLLFSPLIKNISYTLEKPIIIIGQDNSLSVRNQPAGFNKSKYEQDIKALADQLALKYDVRIYNFSDNIYKGFNFLNPGKLTNASKFISKLNDEFLNRNVGAVIMATDGIFNRGGNPLYDLAKLKAPLYTIALGDTIPKQDILISNINYNNLVYLNNEFTVEVQLQAFESKGQKTQLSVFESGRKVHKQQILITDEPFAKSYSVKLKAAKLGLQKYTFNLGALNNEASQKNNVQNILVEVIDDRQKVLLAAASAHPDLAALRQAIELNKHYEVNVALNEELNTINASDYGLVVLYQLPGLQFNASSFIRKVQSSKASLWYIIGAESNIMSLNQFQKLVSFNVNTGMLQDAYSYVNPEFNAFSTTNLSKNIISQFEPLQTPSGKININANHTVLLLQQIDKINIEVPQLFFSNEPGKKTGFLIGEGLWRWKLAEAKRKDEGVFNPLISQIIQYLSVKDDLRKFKVSPSKSFFDEDENVILNATLYNDSFMPVIAPDVSIEINNNMNKKYKFTFSKVESGYELDAGILEPGSYTYVANTQLGNKKYKIQGSFFINDLVAEYQQTIANHQLLYNLSAQTKGKMYMPQNLLATIKDLERNEQVKTLSYENRKYEELIDLKWLFFLIMTFLGLEWLLRKRSGDI